MPRSIRHRRPTAGHPVELAQPGSSPSLWERRFYYAEVGNRNVSAWLARMAGICLCRELECRSPCRQAGFLKVIITPWPGAVESCSANVCNFVPKRMSGGVKNRPHRYGLLVPLSHELTFAIARSRVVLGHGAYFVTRGWDSARAALRSPCYGLMRADVMGRGF